MSNTELFNIDQYSGDSGRTIGFDACLFALSVSIKLDRVHIGIGANKIVYFSRESRQQQAKKFY